MKQNIEENNICYVIYWFLFTYLVIVYQMLTTKV